jgi:NAD+ synthase (glutamine-hydrolysing)
MPACQNLIQFLIRWVIATKQFDEETGAILQSIVDTEISPELVPASDNEENGEPAQKTEAKIGPYELQDFNTYYITRYGLRPSKVAFLSHHAWGNKRSAIIRSVAAEKRNEYSLREIKHWLKSFCGAFSRLRIQAQLCS